MLNIIKDLDSNIVQQIIRYINDEEVIDHIPQPMFIVGRRGSGKSTILKQLIKRLKNSGLSGRILHFDGKRFFKSQDIIRAIEGMDYDGSTSIINDHIKERRIVIIDDLDYFFKRSTFDSQYLLRNYLNHDSSPLLIATISEIDDSLADYRAPFFEGVRLIYIPPLDDSIVSTLGISTKQQQRLTALMEYLPPVIHSLKLASDIVSISDDAENDLQKLLNISSSIYRDRLENLPVYSQKILCALAMSKEALTLAELREQTDISGGILSPYLRKLVTQNIIQKTNSKKRRTLYEIRDNLFKLWLSSSK